VVLGLVRPDSWDLPLFVHVLGAILLFGGVASVATLAFASIRSGEQNAALLQRVAFVTTLALVWPAWVLMRAGAGWIQSREDLESNPPGWIDVGMAVSDVGILVLLLLTLFAWLSRRRAWAGTALAALSALYLVALGVAWLYMSAKP
jgi:hypothetical protein